MTTYAKLASETFDTPLLRDEPPAALPPELELQALWLAGAFGRDFVTVEGRSVHIIQFGEWNRSAGPDFVQCAVEVDGKRLLGAIELDSTSEDWVHHGHATDPEYRKVALHVVFQRSRFETFTRDCDHREIPKVVVDPLDLRRALQRPRHEVAIARMGRCLRPLATMDSLAIERLLKEAALHRAQRKAARFEATASIHGRDAALFQATAETLGYRGNSLAMRLLAQRAPLASMKEEMDHEALLFGTAGFLSPAFHEKAPADTKDYLRSLWDIWWKQRGRYETGAQRAIPWKLHGHRPANHPHRRVGALAALVGVWPEYRRLAFSRPFRPEEVIRFLGQLEHPFWQRRHTLTSPATGKTVALFGQSHALELLANHLIPFALLEDDRLGYDDYWRIRAKTPNDRVKRCALRLFGSLDTARPWFKSLAHHQALLQIYHDFCLEDVSECDQCPFPEQLAQWRA